MTRWSDLRCDTYTEDIVLSCWFGKIILIIRFVGEALLNWKSMNVVHTPMDVCLYKSKPIKISFITFYLWPIPLTKLKVSVTAVNAAVPRFLHLCHFSKYGTVSFQEKHLGNCEYSINLSVNIYYYILNLQFILPLIPAHSEVCAEASNTKQRVAASLSGSYILQCTPCRGLSLPCSSPDSLQASWEKVVEVDCWDQLLFNQVTAPVRPRDPKTINAGSKCV